MFPQENKQNDLENAKKQATTELSELYRYNLILADAKAQLKTLVKSAQTIEAINDILTKVELEKSRYSALEKLSSFARDPFILSPKEKEFEKLIYEAQNINDLQKIQDDMELIMAQKQAIETINKRFAHKSKNYDIENLARFLLAMKIKAEDVDDNLMSLFEQDPTINGSDIYAIHNMIYDAKNIEKIKDILTFFNANQDLNIQNIKKSTINDARDLLLNYIINQETFDKIEEAVHREMNIKKIQEIIALEIAKQDAKISALFED